MLDAVFNLSDLATKRELMTVLSIMQGPHRVRVCEAKRNRSDAHNAWYFAVPVKAFQKYLADQGQKFDTQECHEILARKFLSFEITDKNTGEIIGDFVFSIKEVNFDAYCKMVTKYLESLGIVTV